MATPSKQYLYVYCAVRGATVPPRALAKLPAMPGGSAPRALGLTGDIALVVADVPEAIYRTDTIEARLTDLEWVAICGAAHHGVADALALKHNVVPFRLFTLFSSEAKALATLGRATRRIDEALDRVKGKAEWVLRIAKGPPSGGPSQTSGAPSSTAKAGLKAGPSGAPSQSAPSGTAFLAGKAAAKKAAAETAMRVRKDAAAVFDALEEIADQANQRSLEAATGLLLDAAFLVPGKREAAFKKALTKAAAGLLRDGCRVTLTGPWPPYSFVALETRSHRG